MLSLSTLFVAPRPLLAAIGDVGIVAVVAGDISCVLSSGDVVSVRWIRTDWVSVSDTLLPLPLSLQFLRNDLRKNNSIAARFLFASDRFS